MSARSTSEDIEPHDGSGGKQRVPIYQLDAFTTGPFSGNPAAVMVLERFPSDAVLRSLAAENNLSETAFLVPGSGEYQLRWFTPVTEVPLCGHATLASAAVVLERLEPGRTNVVFRTQSGALAVRREGGTYVMDFPAQPAVRTEDPGALSAALRDKPQEVWANAHSLLAVFSGEEKVRGLEPDMAALERLEPARVIATAAAEPPYDFVSRFFAPALGVPEDPVTGSAHCTLAPFWAQRLGKRRLRAFQASRRGGELFCEPDGDRVALEGRCTFYLEGQAEF